MTKIFSYQGKTYQTSIAPSGLLYKGTFGKTEVFRSLSVVGNYIDTSEKYDTRLFQQSAKEVSATVEQLGNNRVRIVSTGTIGNKKYPEAATYRQTTLFEPEGMKIDYQFTSKVPMATRMDIFGSLMNLPLTAVIDRGMACATAKAKNELISIPATCEKGKGIHKGELSFREDIVSGRDFSGGCGREDEFESEGLPQLGREEFPSGRNSGVVLEEQSGNVSGRECLELVGGVPLHASRGVSGKFRSEPFSFSPHRETLP